MKVWITLKKIMEDLQYLEIDMIDKNNSLSNNCPVAKMYQLQFEYSEIKTENSLDLLHIDLWDLSPTTPRNGNRYFATIVNNTTKYTWIFPLKAKSEFITIFKKFQRNIEN